MKFVALNFKVGYFFIHIAQYVQENLCAEAQRLDRGVRQAGFLVLNATSMPSILVELGYISHAEEAKYLASANGQKKMSRCISQAFDKYYADLKKGSTGTTIAEAAPLPQTTAKGNTAQTTSTEEDKPVFKIQFLTTSKKLEQGDKAFKGLNPVGHYTEKGMYKYTYGNTTDYNEIVRLKRKVNENFKDAFIVAFIKGERIETQQAIALFKKNNP